MIKSLRVDVECNLCGKAYTDIKVDPIKAQTYSVGTIVAAQLNREGWKALNFIAACPECKTDHKKWREATNAEVKKIHHAKENETEPNLAI